MKSSGISILGSTGSIGCSTLQVVEFLGDLHVVGLGAGRNIEKFAEQVITFRPELASCETEEGAEELLRRLHKSKITPPKILLGEEGLVAVATLESAGTVVSATVGAVGFVPTMRALEAGKRVALANKETLVMAGELMTKAAGESGAEILPVDSEHNAIHQCLRGELRDEVRRLILTASGGPFRTKTKADIDKATREEALNHPTWNMGDKITIDSATMMNKGLEVIEARWLFGFDADRIDILVHPQSVVHSMVEMVDGSIIAQLGVTDMKHAIQYALTYPGRQKNCLPPLDFASIARLTFEDPDFERFPCPALAYRALRNGGTMPAVLNAANEVAVEAFLDDKIRLSDISRIIESVMNEHEIDGARDIESVLAADKWSRTRALELLSARATTAT